jgi:hypothetical protein
VESALSRDVPVAFLNLCSGEEKNLQEWHWATIISLQAEENGLVFVHILDEGAVRVVNLTLWLETTTRGGGFVCFDKE